METNRTYKVRKHFLVPFCIDVALLFILLVISFLTESTQTERIVLALVFLPLLLILLESASRETTIAETGITIKKFMRTKKLTWEDITNLDTMSVRKKVYLLLTTTRGFYILANSHENFTSMVRDIVDGVGREKVEERVHGMIAHPVKRLSDIMSSWIAAFILVGALFLKICM